MSDMKAIPEIFLPTLALYVLVMAYLGYVASKKTDTMKEFLTMGGAAGAIVGGLAYLTTQYSMSTFMGVPGSCFKSGWAIAGMTLTTAFTLWLPSALVGGQLQLLSKKIQLYTLSDYFASRYYSKFMRLIVCVLTVGLILPVMGAQTLGAGIIWRVFTGYPEWMGVVVMSVVVTGYCLYGGIRGAMLTDVAQAMLMIFTSIFLFIAVLNFGGGLSEMNARLAALDIGRMSFPGSPVPAATYGWLFGNLFLWTFFTMGFPQLSTKFFSMKNYETVIRSSICAAIAAGFMQLLIYAVGSFSPLILGLDIPRADFAIPLLSSKLLSGWMASIMMAGILAAGMSTIDSMLVVTAGSVVRDFYHNFVNTDATDAQQFGLIRKVTVALGVIGCLIGIFKPGTIFGIILFSFGGIGVLAIPLLLGVRWKRATREGAIVATIAGEIYHVVAVLYPAYAFGWQAGIPALALTLVVMVAVSLITPRPPLAVLRGHYE